VKLKISGARLGCNQPSEAGVDVLLAGGIFAGRQLNGPERVSRSSPCMEATGADDGDRARARRYLSMVKRLRSLEVGLALVGDQHDRGPRGSSVRSGRRST
jgi:hypothetical protein